MPVTFGASTVLAGSGTWTYPDPTLIIGVKLDLTTAPDGHSGSTGSEVVRWRGIGVWQPVDEAAPLEARPIVNPTTVEYDIGRAPSGLAFELLNGAQVTATEVLSASPTGGGGVDRGSGCLTSLTSEVLPGFETGTLTLNCSWCSDWPGSNADGLVVPVDGFYVASLYMSLSASGGVPTTVSVVLVDHATGSNFTERAMQAWPGSDTLYEMVWSAIVSSDGSPIPAGTQLLPRAWSDTPGTLTATYKRFTMR